MKSIGTKLAIQIAIGLICIMGLGIVFASSSQKKYELTLLDEKEGRTLQLLSLLVSEQLYMGHDEQIENIFRSYLSDPEILSLKIQHENSLLGYLGKDPESGDIIDLSTRGTNAFSHIHSLERHHELVYQEETLGELSAVFSRQGMNERLRRGSLSMSLFFVFIIVVESVLIVLLIKKHVSSPLSRLAQAALQIADGDITLRFQRSSTPDEIGILGSAFDTMIAYLQDMADVATNISKGNLRREVRPRSEYDVLGLAFHDMSLYLNEIAEVAEAIADGDFRREIQAKSDQDLLGQAFQKLGGLRETIGEIMESSTRLYSASEHLSQTSTQMTSSMEQISQKTHVVSSTSQRISENANSVAVGLEEISANIREISRHTKDVVKATDTAVQLTASTTDTISDLEDRSKEIGDIIQVITSVTQQTNLLALNATIEAARAGDAGKGFAVVAKEIKNLSMETASSAENIILNLEMIRDGSRHVSQANAKTMEFTTQIQGLAQATASGIEEQSLTTNELAERMGEAAEETKGITLAISDIASTAQQNSKGVSTIQHASTELAELAARLQALIKQFNI